MNISNRYLDLKPIVARLAAAEGLEFLSRDNFDVVSVDPENHAVGKKTSQWVVMTRTTWVRSGTTPAGCASIIPRSSGQTILPTLCMSFVRTYYKSHSLAGPDSRGRPVTTRLAVRAPHASD